MRVVGEKSYILNILYTENIYNYSDINAFKITVIGAKESVSAILAKITQSYITIEEEDKYIRVYRYSSPAKFKIIHLKDGYYVGIFYHPDLTKNIIRAGDYLHLFNLLQKNCSVPLEKEWTKMLYNYFQEKELLVPILEKGLALSSKKYYYLNNHNINEIVIQYITERIELLLKEAQDNIVAV